MIICSAVADKQKLANNTKLSYTLMEIKMYIKKGQIKIT